VRELARPALPAREPRVREPPPRELPARQAPARDPLPRELPAQEPRPRQSSAEGPAAEESAAAAARLAAEEAAERCGPPRPRSPNCPIRRLAIAVKKPAVRSNSRGLPKPQSTRQSDSTSSRTCCPPNQSIRQAGARLWHGRPAHVGCVKPKERPRSQPLPTHRAADTGSPRRLPRRQRCQEVSYLTSLVADRPQVCPTSKWPTTRFGNQMCERIYGFVPAGCLERPLCATVDRNLRRLRRCSSPRPEVKWIAAQVRSATRRRLNRGWPGAASLRSADNQKGRDSPPATAGELRRGVTQRQ